MFKTIFSKLIIVFVSILLFSFIVTGVMLYYFLYDFASTEKVRLLEQRGEYINSLLKTYLENKDNHIVAGTLEGMLVEAVESSGAYTRSIIWIANNNGKIDPRFMTSGVPGRALNNQVISKLTDKSGDLQLPDVRQYRKVMLGQEDPVVEKSGDFYGLFKDTGVSWLTIEKPFKYKDGNGKEQILGAVFLHTPLPEIAKARLAVFRLFMIAVLISILAAVILVYIFSLRISKPLKQINNAAREISGGEFQKRLNINSNDEIGELASSFNHMVTALQNLEEMRRGFIANVSHELRTPMTSIRGFIDGILDGTIPPDKQNMYLTIVKDETERLNRLVNDLLDLARMESGEMKLRFINFNINELIRRCIIKLENQILQKDIQVEADFEEEEMFVNADADAIERVIINLIHNAIKFSNMNGRIILKTFTQKDKVLVSIEDNGIGIGKDEIDLIWDRFYKSDKSRSKEKSGTGLGLAIIKNIISEHKQEIWVESEPGKGTGFTFTLDKEQVYITQ